MNFTGPRFVPTHPNIVELDRIGDEIAELSAHLDAAAARLLDPIREFDARGGWNNGACLSCAHWIWYHVGLERRAARERVRVARALGRLPQLAQAFARGELSYSKVRALTRIATPETEERLLKVGRAGTAEHVERIVRGWRRVDRKIEVEDTARRHKHRAFQAYHDEDGMVVIRARLEPQAGAVVIQAIAAAWEALRRKARANDSTNGSAGPQFVDGSAEPRYQDGSPEAPTYQQQEADALALIAETALNHGIPGTPGERYQVVVHVDAAVLADADAPGQSVLEDSAYVPAETSQRLACDASRVVIRHDTDGRITEVGARTRTIPPALRRALEHRDRGCRFPGCGRRFGQGHHIRHWAHGGPTTLSNLTLLCRKHHRAVHEEGFQVERQATGELYFRRPDGTLWSKARRFRRYQAILSRSFAHGMPSTAFTSTPGHRSPTGSETVWTLARRSTSYIQRRPASACQPWRRDRCELA